MNTNNLKKFAKEARRILMQGVGHRLAYWGFDENGNVVEEVHPIKDGYIFREQPFDDREVPKKWQNLQTSIKRHSTKDVIEEAAYTWFNRLLVIKILEKNNYITPKLEYLSIDLTDPRILSDARKGKIEYLKSNDKEKLNRYLQESDDEKAFGLLLSNYCQANPLLKRLFGYIDDYTELLLPNNLLMNDGIISLINSDEFITDDDFKQVELIGWLYQFYISDKKDDVFASFKKAKKARAEDIPAATQIFTPKWIVKYLVENTMGRIWLDKHPESPIRETMKYLVEPKNTESGEPIIDNVTELKVLDPAVGSGHFLVVAFDLLMQAYKEEGYTNRNAVESIITHNLYGLDICKRAVGLANFAILLKGASYYPDILCKDVALQIVAMPEPYEFAPQQINDFLGENGRHYVSELQTALEEMQQAQNIGSALVLDLTDGARDVIAKRLNEFSERQKIGELDLLETGLLNTLKPFLRPILMLTDTYPAVVANPPYIGSGNMNADLSDYSKSHYPKSKSDLFAVFMEVIPERTMEGGCFGQVNLPSWLFLSSFENLRKKYVDNYKFLNLLHMGRGIFGIDWGSVAFTIKKQNDKNSIGDYFRLHERNFQHIYCEDIEKLFLYSNGNPKFKYDFKLYRDDEGVNKIPETGTKEGIKVFYKGISQFNFEKIPGSPIAYWIGETGVSHFENDVELGKVFDIKQGLTTSENKRFLRLWYEVAFSKIGFGISSREQALDSLLKWFPYNKGGDQRKWYGNLEYVVNWEKDGYEVKKLIVSKYSYLKGNPDFVAKNPGYYFKSCITWSKISSGSVSFRYQPKGIIFSDAGMGIFCDDDNSLGLLSLVNSKPISYFLRSLNPTLNYQAGDISKLPVFEKDKMSDIKISQKSIEISKSDWDSRETSWDFKKSPLLNNSTSLKQDYQIWQKQVTKDFFQLHAIEEQLNRIYIDIYGLKEELTPEVALKDITILHKELDRNTLEQLESDFREKGTDAIVLPINKAEVLSQFISYAVGCFMGRFKLDKPGLNIAHPNPTEDELSAYSYHNHNFEIDDDGIIPTMGEGSPFSDDIVFRVKEFIQMVWGEDTLTENLNFINECLGEDLEKYLANKFWADHKKTYKNKPIYWLFGSPDKAFQVLVYMHRMNRFTIQKIRNNYLLKYLNYLNDQIGNLEADESSLSRNDAKRLDTLRIAQMECREYDKLLKDYADRQIEFDLDDGVTVNHDKFEGIVVKI